MKSNRYVSNVSTEASDEKGAGTPNIYCGIWMQLDAILSREMVVNVWDKRLPRFPRPAGQNNRKKDGGKFGRNDQPVISASSSPIAQKTPKRSANRNGANSTKSATQSLVAVKSVQWPNDTVADIQRDFPPMDLIRSNSDVSLNWAERKLLRITDKNNDNYVNSLIECSFNFPRVSNQLKRLMGTNVVRLTDRNYMVDLRRRIQEDCVELQAKRIENREHIEAVREMNLILKGFYTPENCPPRLVIVHSIALAAEMERQRNLIMQEGTVRCPPEYDKHSVFVTNQKTNAIIAHRRSKLKTTRERNVERLVHLGDKWEKERFKYNEIDRQKAAEKMEKQRIAKEMEQVYNDSNRARGMDLLRIKNRDFTECEFDLVEFLEIERNRMLNRLKKKRVPIQFSVSQKLASETGSPDSNKADETDWPTTQSGEQIRKSTSKSKTSNMTKSEMLLNSKTLSATEEVQIPGGTISEPIDVEKSRDSLSFIEELATAKELTDEEHMEMLHAQREQCLKDGYMLQKPNFDHLHYEDPRVTELKRTDTVQEMYNMADEIICSLYDINNLKVETVESEEEK